MPRSTFDVRDAAILVIDDEHANVRLLKSILQRAGFKRVEATTSSGDAARLFLALSPDLVILDIRMPHPDGFAVLAQLSEVVPAGELVPVLAVTGDDAPDLRKRVIAAGAQDFLGKPFEPSEVVVRVENLLATRFLHRSLQRQNERLEDTVRDRTAALESALAVAQSASAAKSRFLATMSHELRTPLNAIIGFSNHLRKNKAGNLAQKDLGLLARIGENGTALLRIINDVLDLSRVEAGKVEVQSAPVALDRVIAETLALIATAPGESHGTVEVRTHIPAGLDAINTDEQKLRRILGNLVGNALKFTETGRVIVGIRSNNGRPLSVDVIDTGIGIAADRMDAIFNVFEQAESGTERRYGGTGLGLAISKTLSELLGFRLSVLSEPGRGSAFSLLLDRSAAVPGSYAELVSTYPESAALCA